MASVAAAPGGLSTTLHSSDRWTSALLLLVVGGTHLVLVPEHLEEAPYVGFLFLCLSVVCARSVSPRLVGPRRADAGSCSRRSPPCPRSRPPDRRLAERTLQPGLRPG